MQQLDHQYLYEYIVLQYMTENKDKKSQIQLLKQKYLKKNITVQTNQPISSPRSINIEQLKKPIIQTNQLTNSPKSQIKPIILTTQKSQQKQQLIKSQQPSANEWKLRDFMQEKVSAKEDKLQNKQSTNNKKKIDILQAQGKQYQKQVFNQQDPFSLKINFKFVNDSHVRFINQDPQFIQQQTESQKHQLLPGKPNIKNSTRIQKDLSYACKIWLQNPQKALNYLIFSNPTPTLQVLPKPLILNSTNPSFPGIVQQLAQQFIFNNNSVLKDAQKQVVYKMALQYFSPSPNQLSDVLLICLVKIMPMYGSIYLDQIIRKIGYYIPKIIQYKKYILKEQLDIFIKCMQQRLQNLRIQGCKLPLQCYIWILILRSNSNYCNQILLVRSIQNQKDLLTIFCALYPEGRQNILSILYLKCIDSLIPLFIKSGILQKVISHLNEIKVPQLLYQPVKSLKLKLIKNADPKKQKKKSQQDKGFTNFLNQRISKLKDVLQSKVINKSKSQIYYNLASGRYELGNLHNSKNVIG